MIVCVCVFVCACMLECARVMLVVVSCWTDSCNTNHDRTSPMLSNNHKDCQQRPSNGDNDITTLTTTTITRTTMTAATHGNPCDALRFGGQLPSSDLGMSK